MQRASHALKTEAGVYVIDPVEVPGALHRVRALGSPAGVIQLLDRHRRDSRTVAAKLDVPLHVVPTGPVVGSPFELIPVVSGRHWNEVALWWPDEAVLVVADVLGSAPYYRAPGEKLAVHPLLRFTPPRELAAREPVHILCGHGVGVHGEDAAPALHEAVSRSRRRAPAWALARVRGVRRR